MKIWIFVLLFLTSCNSDSTEKLVVRTSPVVADVLKSDGPYELKKGMYDGCVTAMWTRGNSFTRANLRFRHDPELALNDLYHFGWKNGYKYCFLAAIFYYNKQFGSSVQPSDFAGAYAPTSVPMPVGGAGSMLGSQMLNIGNTNDGLNFNVKSSGTGFGLFSGEGLLSW